MNCISLQAKAAFSVFVMVFLSGFAFGQTPDAGEILRGARASQVSRSATISAELRHGRDEHPFLIAADQGTVRYIFKDPAQELILRIDDSSSTLSERVGGDLSAIKPARFDERIRGTPITYEDLSLEFLYWPRAKVVGDERIGATGQDAWIVELQHAPQKSQYGVVRVWVDKKSGALTQIHGFNRQGRKIKQFTVVSIQRIDGEWMLKDMRIEGINPETGKPIRGDRAYLTIKGVQ